MHRNKTGANFRLILFFCIFLGAVNLRATTFEDYIYTLASLRCESAQTKLKNKDRPTTKDVRQSIQKDLSLSKKEKKKLDRLYEILELEHTDFPSELDSQLGLLKKLDGAGLNEKAANVASQILQNRRSQFAIAKLPAAQLKTLLEAIVHSGAPTDVVEVVRTLYPSSSQTVEHQFAWAYFFDKIGDSAAAIDIYDVIQTSEGVTLKEKSEARFWEAFALYEMEKYEDAHTHFAGVTHSESQFTKPAQC